MSSVLSEKTVKVFSPPTSKRAFRTKHAAYMAWAKDLMMHRPLKVRTVMLCNKCGHEAPRSACVAHDWPNPCEFVECVIPDQERWMKVKTRLARWLKWLDSRAA